MLRACWFVWLCGVLVSPLSAGEADDEIWLLVDSGRDVLEVRNGDRILAEFSGVARGQAGLAEDRRRDSRETPLGEFRIGWINPYSEFHLFFGLDYPRPEHARRALESGDLDYETYLDIIAAGARGQVPPQNTVLGGHIGIHGIGDGDPEVHEAYHWTEGCVALTNEQIEALSEWVEEGMRVVIR